MTDGEPFTPQQLAVRWGVTSETVRSLIQRRALHAFRVGPRLLRVTASAVAEYEVRLAQKPTAAEEAARARDVKVAALDSALLIQRIGRRRGGASQPR